MDVESQQSGPSEPEPTSPTKLPAPQTPAASSADSATPPGAAVSPGGEERAVVRGARVDDTYVRTRIPPISHAHPTDEVSAQKPTAHTGRRAAWLQRAARLRLRGALPTPRLVPRVLPRLARGWLGKLAVVGAPTRLPTNWRLLLGMVAAGVLLAAFILVRFGRGGWIAVALIVGLGPVPLVAARWRGTARQDVRARKETEARIPLLARTPRHIVIVPISGINQPALQCLFYARSIIPEVRAVYVATDEAREAAVRADWQNWIATYHPPSALADVSPAASAGERDAGGPPRRMALLPPDPRLVVIESPTRTLLPPLVAYIAATCDSNLDAIVTIILPEWMPEHWWQRPVANWTARRLRLALYPLPRVVVTTVPYHSPT